MDSNILLSKIVSNPTDNTWAQVYTTLNLYVALSIKSETTEGAEAKSDTNIATSGKELLERLQREYFSQDTKSLENIKTSVEEAVKDFENLQNISIVLANLTGEVLYIVMLGAKVVLRRNGKVATIADGTPGKVEAFSGKIQADDTIILETAGFSEKITLDKLSSSLDHLDVSEISESLAPLVHHDPSGTEAAVILQYKKLGAAQEETTQVSEHPEEGTLEALSVKKPAITQEEQIEEEQTDLKWEKQAETHYEDEAHDPISHLADGSKPSGQISKPKFFSNDRKVIIIIVIILLIGILGGSIYFEKTQKEKAQQNAALNEILSPAQKKFDEANALISLNKGLALDEFTSIKESVTQDENKLPAGSDARKKLDDFIKQVDGKINDLGSGATLTNEQKIFDDSAFVAYRNKHLYSVSSDGIISLLDESGKSSKDINSKNKSVSAIGANDTDVFVVGSSGISNGLKVVVKNPGTVVSLDTFGSNLYALNTADKTVDKYPTSSYSKSSYFTDSVTLNNPSSMSIDSSIWIVDSGKIRKFTKGKEDSFSPNGLTKDISSSSQITTNVDYENVYVLDATNGRIIAISKDGSVKNQYVSKDLAHATSFAVDEPGKKMFVVISGKLYSFDL